MTQQNENDKQRMERSRRNKKEERRRRSITDKMSELKANVVRVWRLQVRNDLCESGCCAIRNWKRYIREWNCVVLPLLFITDVSIHCQFSGSVDMINARQFIRQQNWEDETVKSLYCGGFGFSGLICACKWPHVRYASINLRTSK